MERFIKSIVLITGDVEQPALSSRLLEHNNMLEIVSVTNKDELKLVDQTRLPTCRIISFVSDVIVPAGMLKLAGFGAYNIHPGSPDFPGWAPAIFAFRENARRFGATAHVMTENIDGGEIVDLEMFDVPEGADILELELLSYSAALRIFWRLSNFFANEITPTPAIQAKWGAKKYSKKDL